MNFRNILFIGTIIICTFDQIQSQNCIGDAGQVTWSHWYDLESRSWDFFFANEDFPNNPDETRVLGSLNTPNSYTDNFGSMIRGYISVPQSGTATFNLTGDDQTRFYLSTNQSPDNLQLLCEIENWTRDDEHDKEVTQTSSVITFLAGQYYYFEMYNLEGNGGDHMQVYWQRSWAGDTEWVIVDFAHLNDYACAVNCAPTGTPCDDGNGQTYNDQEDGNCNCVGTYPTNNTCIGPRGTVEAYYYDSIPGSRLTDLYEDPTWPLMPSRKEFLKGAYGPNQYNTNNDYGTFVQGYLTVPESGSYDFIVTGDNRTQLFLSSDDTEANKEAHSVFITGSTDLAEFDKYPEQQLNNVSLQAGQYYYFEFHHKESSWRDHFHLYWKPPFLNGDDWKRFPKFYLFDYGCDLPCVPAGTLCDDGDPYTDNDVFDESCECRGTPCAPGDCDEAPGSFAATESCSATDNLDIRPETSWLSCSNQQNPNPARSAGHWIHYDLGSTYKLKNSKIWNYNAPGMTDRGFQSVVVDYSMDGVTWQSLGNFNWEQAPGNIDYPGFNGPNFNDIPTRHILITALSNHGNGQCSGFSKVLFNGMKCGPAGTPCDDGDPFTTNDIMDGSCNCIGTDIAINDCQSDLLNLGYNSLDEDNYSASQEVKSGNIVSGGKAVSFVAGESIVIMPGFVIGGEAVLEAQIEDCIQNIVSEEMLRALKTRKQKKLEKASLPPMLQLDGLNNQKEEKLKKDYREVIYRLDQPAEVIMELIDENGKVVSSIVSHYHDNRGTYKKYVPKIILRGNNYQIKVSIDGNVLKTNIPAEVEKIRNEE